MENKIGAYLRTHREKKKLSLEEVAKQTGIKEHYLADLESGDFSKIPGDVFIRGFLRNYGNYLGLDGNGLVEAYRTGSEPGKMLETRTMPKLKEQLQAKNNLVKTEKKVTETKLPPPHKEENKELEATRVMPSALKKEPPVAAPQISPEEQGEKEKSADQNKTPEVDKKELPTDSLKKEVKIKSWMDRVKSFIDNNLYEMVPVDGEETPPPAPPAGGADEQKGYGQPAFSFKVFAGVFFVCLAIFTGVMAYFVFGGKNTEEVKATNTITDVKSDHSSEKKETPDEKKQEAQKEEKKEEKQEKPTTKTLGLGSRVTVEISYKKPVWTQTTIDGKNVEAAIIPAGSTRTYKGDDKITVNLGSIRDVVLKVDGEERPYGEKEWGVVTKTFYAQ